MKLIAPSAVLFVSIFVLGACAVEAPAEEGEGSTESSLSAAHSVSLKYEGTCEFLRTCSSYSKSLPVGKVTWGCTGVGACSDDALWVAAPNRSFCGKSVQFCKGGHCTTALVKDVSVSKNWEASNGVLDALGLPHGLRGKCGGYGGGAATVEVGGKAVEEDDAGEE